MSGGENYVLRKFFSSALLTGIGHVVRFGAVKYAYKVLVDELK